jgi:hypothetical protein
MSLRRKEVICSVIERNLFLYLVRDVILLSHRQLQPSILQHFFHFSSSTVTVWQISESEELQHGGQS